MVYGLCSVNVFRNFFQLLINGMNASLAFFAKELIRLNSGLINVFTKSISLL